LAEFITGFETADGVKKYDYNSLANKPEDGTGTIISGNADYAEVGEWSDGNPGSEDRLGYFVAIAAVGDNTIKIRKATSEDDVKGVTVFNPAFSGNAAAEKYVSDGVLYPQYSYVGLMGIVSVIDNGTCTVGGRCMPANDGTAIPSTNNMGYGVLERIDENHVLIAVEPGADMIQRIKTQIVELQNRPSGGGNGVSDWNQHDANGRGYINSRPFYEVDAGTKIYENTDLQLQGTSGRTTEAWLPNQIDIIEGESYYVSWEGKSHKVTATRSSDMSLELHNLGEFYIRTVEGDAILDVDYNKTRILSYNGLTSVSLAIYTTQAAIKKIDKKFLPDDIGGGGIANIAIFPETNLAFEDTLGTFTMAEIADSIELVEGKTYKVKWGDTVYECVAGKDDHAEGSLFLGNGKDIGEGNTGEPFLIRSTKTGSYATSSGKTEIRNYDATHNVIVGITAPGMIDAKSIPDMYYTEDGEMVEILPEMTSEVLPDDSMIPIMNDFEIVAGNTYIVKWNGVEYERIALDIAALSGGEITGVGIGNPSALGGEDTGEPFAIVYSPAFVGSMIAGGKGLIIALDGSTSVTVSILGNGTTIHHIPPKYIKDMYYEEVIEEKEILPEMTLTSTDFTVERTLFTLKPNYPYKVIYDGTSYSCISKTYVADSGTLVYLGYSVLLGGENTGEPFGILSMGGGTLFSNKDANVTISIIEGGKIVHKIDEKYIPIAPNAVPNTRKINNKELSSDITLTATDVGAVPPSRTINGQALSSNIVLSSKDVNGVERGVYTIDGETFVAKTGAEVFNTMLNSAVGFYSHAEGYDTVALGGYSHAEGNGTKASGPHSHAEGYSTTASASNSHAEGVGTTASGLASHAEGNGTIALANDSHVEGRYNIPDEENKYAHIVGNGLTDARSNAHTLDWRGNAWYAGSVECDSVILRSCTSGSTKKFRLSVTDSGSIAVIEMD
jgi:hypothetical protein